MPCTLIQPTNGVLVTQPASASIWWLIPERQYRSSSKSTQEIELCHLLSLLLRGQNLALASLTVFDLCRRARLRMDPFYRKFQLAACPEYCQRQLNMHGL